jgi:predicted nucleic acid-binding Zn ribbon protein
MSELPSKEEYIKQLQTIDNTVDETWDKALFRCPQCNGDVKKDYSIMYMTNPPKYRYFCKSCGYSVII